MRNRQRIYLFAAGLLLSASGMPAQTNAALQPFTIDHRKALLTHSPVDVSFLLDVTAANSAGRDTNEDSSGPGIGVGTSAISR